MNNNDEEFGNGGLEQEAPFAPKEEEGPGEGGGFFDRMSRRTGGRPRSVRTPSEEAWEERRRSEAAGRQRAEEEEARRGEKRRSPFSGFGQSEAERYYREEDPEEMRARGEALSEAEKEEARKAAKGAFWFGREGQERAEGGGEGGVGKRKAPRFVRPVTGTAKWLAERPGETQRPGESDADYERRMLRLRGRRGERPKPRGVALAQSAVKALGQPKKKSDYLLYGKPSPAIYDVSPGTIAAARMHMPGMTPFGAGHATGMTTGGALHSMDLSAMRELSQFPVHRDVYQEVRDNNDRDTMRHIKGELGQLGHRPREVEQAVRDLDRAGYIDKEGTKEGGSPVYIIVR